MSNSARETLWNMESPAADVDGVTVPRWIDQEITGSTIAAICQGGCASGAYMPAVTYWEAIATMGEHGDEVLDFIEDATGDLPTPGKGLSWSAMACHYLSAAVELWAYTAAAIISGEEVTS